MNWFVMGQRLQLKYNHLVVCPKQEVFLVGNISSLVLKKAWQRLGHPQDWMGTLLLWLSDRETDHL